MFKYLFVNSFLYEISLYLIILILMPKMIYLTIFRGKYRKSLGQRFGRGFPRISKGDRKLVWIHAVSVGETKAIAPLAKKIKQEFDNPILLISNITETGHAEAQRSIPGADYHVYLPLDLSWIIRPIIKRVRPDLVILSETDLWFNFLRSVKETGATTVLVNGKLSNKSMKRYTIFRWFSRSLFSLIDLFCIQSQHYLERFKMVGISEDKIHVTGNLKFDGNVQKMSKGEVISWKQKLGIEKKDPVLVIGSTHDPEEKIMLDILPDIWSQFPALKVILVPRHPERFDIVANFLRQRHIPFVRYSQLDNPSAKVILMDAMGILQKCYQLADIAIVCGSYTPKVGGHNILEPSWYGVPVLFGPYMHTQPELVELVIESGAGIQVAQQELKPTILRFLTHPQQRLELGVSAIKLVSTLHGATDRTWEIIKKL